MVRNDQLGANRLVNLGPSYYSLEKLYKYVDLGLPSGTLLADRNVGANAPEAYGDYFAWGETTTKSTYDWSTYKWCQGSETTMTKYCTNSSYGTVDNKTVLDLEDDAAYVYMGTEWRMPTKEEQDELNSECTWMWTLLNKVYGYKVTGPNGKSIFLPAAGCRLDGSLYDAGSYGHYWSASLDESNPFGAWSLASIPAIATRATAAAATASLCVLWRVENLCIQVPRTKNNNNIQK